MAERTEVSYKGFTLIAALYRGKIQGRAHGETTLSADASDVDAVIEALKAKVDAWLLENSAKRAREREERHRLFLERHGIPYQGVRPATKYREHRVTHCYACHAGLDNEVDTECIACSWILCNCGACGCGWPGRFGPA